MVYTFPSLPRHEAPRPLDALTRQCAELRVFRGTLADGDVGVCALGRPEEGMTTRSPSLGAVCRIGSEAATKRGLGAAGRPKRE